MSHGGRRTGRAPSQANGTGSRRRWRWYKTAAGESVALDEFNDLGRADGTTKRIHTKLVSAQQRYLDGTIRAGGVKHLGDGIYELITQTGTNPYRLLFCKWGRHGVVLTCFYKNQRKTAAADMTRATRRRDDWVRRYGETPAD